MAKEEKKENATGKYVYDKKTGKLVKVSDRATSGKKDGGSDSPSSCGSGGCCCCG